MPRPTRGPEASAQIANLMQTNAELVRQVAQLRAELAQRDGQIVAALEALRRELRALSPAEVSGGGG